LIALVIGLAFGAIAYQTRSFWLPHSLSISQPPAIPDKAPGIGLTTLDVAGQLQIRWDRESPAVRNAEEASLVIQDGGALPQAVQLDSSHLRQGSFTYGRQSERVDVVLTLHLPANQTLREVSTYLGKLPNGASSLAPDDSDLRTTRENAAKDRWRAKKMEKTVEDLRLQLKKEQNRSRLANQSPESVK
jgi:hypothetical protein